jgi:hypothetical protein
MASKKLKIYVWDNVLCDYTPGMIVVIASSLEKAKAIAKERHPSETDIESDQPSIQDIKEGYVAECYGGG